MKKRLKAYLWNLAIAADQFVNTVFSGYPDETFSARVYRKARAGQWFWKLLREIIDGIFFWQTAHCAESFFSEERRAHSPGEFSHE